MVPLPQISTLFPYTTLFRSSCSGSVALRGGLWLNFIYVNVPLMSEPWRSKECIVYSVTLRDNKRDIFHRETEPKLDRKSTRLNSSHTVISYAVFCLKKKNTN